MSVKGEGETYMRILICDDEHVVIENIREHLQEYFTHKGYEMPELITFSDGDSLLEDVGQKDIVFLDIEMPGSNGILVGKKLKSQNPNLLIFITTSYPQYLDDAMDFHVFRYLTKPLEKERLFHGMNRAMDYYYQLTSFVIIDDGINSIKISESDIIYIEAQAKTTLVHTVSGVYPSKKALNSWLDTLNTGSFFRSHRSHVVNMKYVSEFTHETITFSSDYGQAYLSRRKYHQFKKAFFTYIEYNH
ncbi:MAG: LytTR family DNA-binding domain-containing protein [Lachnospiraceae bacterium]|nr:LytTR family DNA-binding domain-containing protein [Lachnospiraceae bacterium]